MWFNPHTPLMFHNRQKYLPGNPAGESLLSVSIFSMNMPSENMPGRWAYGHSTIGSVLHWSSVSFAGYAPAKWGQNQVKISSYTHNPHIPDYLNTILFCEKWMSLFVSTIEVIIFSAFYTQILVIVVIYDNHKSNNLPCWTTIKLSCIQWLWN